MEQFAFVTTTGSSFLQRTPPKLCPSQGQSMHGSSCHQQNRKRSRAKLNCKDQLEPVEDGVTLPELSDTSAIQQEAKWLSDQLTDWLEAEWRQGEPQSIHREIGDRTAQIYKRQRMEGQNDLSSVLIAIGSELEGMDFSSAFVGPWNIANKTSELLLEHRAGPRVKLNPYLGDPNAPIWSPEMEKDRKTEGFRDETTEDERKRSIPSPSLADRFEKMKFLRDVIDESVSKELIDSAVAAAVGFHYDTKTGEWDGKDVDDEHFRKFGNKPPDIVGDEKSPEMTDTLKYMEKQLGLDEEGDHELAEGLNMVIETLHGVELTKIQSNDENDHAFHKRVIVAKWLHLKGGF